MPTADPVLSCTRLCRSFTLGSERIQALDHVDLSITAGEVVAVMGPSGSGKSTLLHIFGLMDRPDSGTMTLLGHPVNDLAHGQRAALRAQSIGFVFQAFHLVDHRSVADNVALPLIYLRVPPKQRRNMVLQAVEWVGLSHRLHAYPGTLSGGERQRVAIARALVHRPAVLLCDEPTGSLDSTNTDRILTLLRRAAEQGIAVTVVTHDPAVSAQADRTVTIRDGRIDQGLTVP